ncbi:hypothetical protein F511_38303 [Dorcoceras hygrometricum]|uniref:Uncharacterized protein n=1 Tax=Dorcoceras hygrometricum TaxID=472368 RepID=A0A2Z7BCI5_9LAMI|nr:hypothetical protein F511_38303 [Dorcoceras hygrometricum]
MHHLSADRATTCARLSANQQLTAGHHAEQRPNSPAEMRDKRAYNRARLCLRAKRGEPPHTAAADGHTRIMSGGIWIKCEEKSDVKRDLDSDVKKRRRYQMSIRYEEKMQAEADQRLKNSSDMSGGIWIKCEEKSDVKRDLDSDVKKRRRYQISIRYEEKMQAEADQRLKNSSDLRAGVESRSSDLGSGSVLGAQTFKNIELLQLSF